MTVTVDQAVHEVLELAGNDWFFAGAEVDLAVVTTAAGEDELLIADTVVTIKNRSGVTAVGRGATLGQALTEAVMRVRAIREG